MDYYLNRDIEPITYINDDGLVCLEEWKLISTSKGVYKVSDLGRIMSFQKKEPLVLKLMPTHKGYLRVDVRTQRTYESVHRLVAIYFIDNPENKEQVNHKNHIKTDNYKDNLEWVSNLENACHSRSNKKGSSKFTGVCSHKKKWASRINLKGKQIRLGLFDTEEEAYEARVKFEKENGIENKYI